MSTLILQNCVKQLKKHFQNDGVNIDDDWLIGCVEYFLSNEPNITIKPLYEQAMDQWTLSDIKISSCSSLPNSILNNKEPFQLNGKFALQLQYIIDISEPCYDQLRKLYNKQMDETNEEKQERESVKKKRVLKLELTDGTQTIFAMEYKPILCLNTELRPGCKILIHGPIRCVNHILLLESQTNIKMLGGESENLLIVNSYENVLLRALGKPLKDKLLENTKEEKLSLANNSKNCINQQQIQNHIIPDDDDDDTYLFLNLDIDMLDEQNVVQQNQQAPPQPQTRNPLNDSNLFADDIDDDSDLIFIENDIEKDISPTKQFNSINSNNKNQRSTTALVNKCHNNNISYPTFEDDDDDYVDHMLEMEDEINNELNNARTIPKSPEMQRNEISIHRNHNNNNMPSSSKSTNCKNLDPSILIEDSFDEEFLNVIPTITKTSSSSQPPQQQALKIPTTAITIIDKNYEFKIRGHSLVLIDQLLEINDKQKNNKIFILKAEINRVIEKLCIKENEWRLGVLLNDNYSKEMLQVRIHSDLIAELSGISAKEITEMRARLRDKPQLKEEISEILQNLKNKLTHINCFMKLSYCFNDNCNNEVSSSTSLSPTASPSTAIYPYVIELIDSVPFLERILNNKLQNENKL